MTSAMSGKLFFIVLFHFLVSTSTGSSDNLENDIHDIKVQMKQMRKEVTLLKKQYKFLMDIVTGHASPAPSLPDPSASTTLAPVSDSHYCDLDIQAYSAYTLRPTGDDCPIPNIEGFVKINGQQVWSGGFCHPNRTNPRGINILLLDPFTFRVVETRRYDMWGDRNASSRLAEYLVVSQVIGRGLIMIGVSADEVTRQLSVAAKNALRNVGVDIDDVSYRGNFCFVTQIGFQEKTLLNKQTINTPTTLTSRLRVRVYVPGTSLNDVQIYSYEAD